MSSKESQLSADDALVIVRELQPLLNQLLELTDKLTALIVMLLGTTKH